MTKKVAVIIGVGPSQGLGAKLCQRFASDDYHVLVAGRTATKLETVASAIRDSGGHASAIVADTTDVDAVQALFAHASEIGTVELCIFNAGNNMPGEFLTMQPEYFEQCWRIACYGGFLFSQAAIKAMLPQGKGSLLLTGASASMRGKPLFAAFTAAKAGLRAMAQSMAREFQSQGIHIGHIVVDGAIDGDRIRKGRPQIAEALGDDGLVDLDGIVDLYHMLHRQPPKAWTHELDVRSFKENW